MDREIIEFDPIGIIRTPHKTPENMPIQGTMDPESTGTIVIRSEYRSGLTDLETFSHIILLYYFHESGNGGKKWMVEPFVEDQMHGVFATRAPRRPNSIGMTVVELDTVGEGEVAVRGVDVLDGTPLIDIKPYISDVDAHGDAKDGWIDGRMASRHLSDDRFSRTLD